MRKYFKILMILGLFALVSFQAEAGREERIKRQNSVKKVNKRNKRNLKKWGLAQVVRWEEVKNG